MALVPGTGPNGRIHAADVRVYADRERRGAATTPVIRATADGGPKAPGATPLAKRAAELADIDLRQVRGTGHRGRITRADVEALRASVSPRETVRQQELRLPLRGLRRTIADRMHRSLQEMAQLTITMKVDMTESVRLRQLLLREWEQEGLRITYTDLVIKAVATALREHPELNARIEGEEIVQSGRVNVGLSVAVDGGLLVPVIHDADMLSLHEIAVRARDLADAARGGALSLDQMSGGTLTVTTLGAYGVESFTPIVNPPEAAIVGVGAVQTEAAFEEDRVFPRQVMRLSLSFDHRLVDGAPAATFLRRIVRILEQPYLML
jgi:pyruvate dehydrogenase E2 component (dihydrolipoamide acetyltransferase)